jgi:hypothetical protein
MSDLLATYQAELALLLRALVIAGVVLGLERGFRRRAERLNHQTDTPSHDAPRREKEA